MKINLNEITEEGQDFLITEKTGELNTFLSDLISTNPYEFKATLRNIGCESYQLLGTVKTSLNTICSRCGNEATHNVSARFNDIILDEDSENVTHSSKSSGQPVEVDSSAPDVSYYKNHIFVLGDFAHEVVALSEPYKVYCKDCQNSNTDFNQPTYEEIAPEFAEKDSPFSSLKGLKLN